MRTKFSCCYILQQIKILTFVQRQSVQMQLLSKISDPQTMRHRVTVKGRVASWIKESMKWSRASGRHFSSDSRQFGPCSGTPNYSRCWDDHRCTFGKQPLSKPKQTTMKTSTFLPVPPHPKTLSFPCQILNLADRRKSYFCCCLLDGKAP